MHNPAYVKPAPEQLLEELISKFGVPAYCNKNGDPCKINERFWVELLATEKDIIHDRDEDRFYVYNPANGLWERQTLHALKGSLSDRMRRANREWKGCAGIMPLDSEHNRRDIISLLRGVVERQDFFENRPPAIHAQNCMIVFERGQPKRTEFSPHFRSRNQLSVAYDPGAECRQFKEELIRPAMRPDDMDLLQKMFGLLVLGVNRPQRIFILSGTPKTGKTTVGLIIQHLIGRRNCVELRTELLGERFEMSRAVGKMMYFGPDVDPHFLQSKGAHRLKSIVGGDPMDAEKKNSNDDFPFEGTLNVLITSNSRLIVRLRGDYGAWHRRLVIIEYNGKPPASGLKLSTEG
jgi:phage/plasmid-associated DNA primase